jgi:hypothetical protein
VKRLRLIYEQLEEAGAYLKRGSLFHLRLALILTDNVGELMMFNALQEVFSRDDWLHPLRKGYEEIGLPLDPVLQVKYSSEERAKAEAEFEPMVRLLEHRLSRLSAAEARVLRIGHALRKDAFHKGQLREDILGPIVRLLFIMVVRMTESFRLSAIISCPLDEDDKAFLLRFGLGDKVYFDYSEETRQIVAAKLLEATEFDLASFRTTLADDLAGRAQSLLEQLTSSYDTCQQSDYGLLRHQCWKESFAQGKKLDTSEFERAFAQWETNAVPTVTTEWLHRFQAEVRQKLNSQDPSQVLATYWALDKEFEPKEKFVDQHLAELDQAIQIQIDIARGK